MEKIIDDMICAAWRHNDEEMATAAYSLMAQFAKTINCPSNWREIGRNMAGKYIGVGWDNGWIEENCKLYEFG